MRVVDWLRVIEVGAALVHTANGDPHPSVSLLLDRLTAAHQLLDTLAIDADATLAGDPLAATRLRRRILLIQRSCPGLGHSANRAVVHHPDISIRETRRTAPVDSSIVSFDGLVRIAAAATTVVPVLATAADGQHAVDIVVGLALDTFWLERLSVALSQYGSAGVARAFNEMLDTGAPVLGPGEMRTMGFAPPGGVPGLPGAGRPGGGLPGTGPGFGPDGPEDLTGMVKAIVDRLRDRDRWSPDILDHRPQWREVLGIGPADVIDQEEIRRIACLVDMRKALTLRSERLPPPRPARVVWSDTITGITPDHGCAGNRIVIAGTAFGPATADRGVVVPTVDGCMPVSVPADDWSDTAITVTLPQEIASGPVGLVDMNYVRAYNDWAAAINDLTRRILGDAACAHATAPDVTYVSLFRECAAATPSNHLRAGMPVIRAFRANGTGTAYVEPGQPVLLEWSLANVEQFRLSRLSGTGPALDLQDPPGTSYALDSVTGSVPTDTVYQLEAEGPCGTVRETITVRLRRVPVLEIEGVEVTQGIQAFRDPVTPANSLPLVQHKDTIVRVYVTVENLAGFGPEYLPDQVTVSGELRVLGAAVVLPALNTAIALPRARLDRAETDHTLNFRIPAALCAGTAQFRANVWTTREFEQPPTGDKVRPTVSGTQSASWTARTPFKVRYVRLSTDTLPAQSDADARALVVRAFDLLPTPPEDIQPARLATAHTSADITTEEGMSQIVSQIDDAHDCTFSEWLLPWEDECPDADGAVWVGVLPQIGWGGKAQGYRLFDTSRNTCIVPPNRIVAAHEMGHTLALNHVNPNVHCQIPPDADDDFDSLPNDGAITVGDAFDPAAGKVVPPDVGLWDMMTYACARWISRENWKRLFNRF